MKGVPEIAGDDRALQHAHCSGFAFDVEFKSAANRQNDLMMGMTVTMVSSIVLPNIGDE